jgi:hypothetical protein
MRKQFFLHLNFIKLICSLQLQTPVQKGAMSGEMWNKSPNRFQIQPLHHWETENYRHQNPSSNNAITLKFNLVHYPSQEVN